MHRSNSDHSEAKCTIIPKDSAEYNKLTINCNNNNDEDDNDNSIIQMSANEKKDKDHWLLRRIYILVWIRQYDYDKALSDLIAGVTLGLTIIPQSIAYAALAGLTSEYGLYSAFIGSIIYVLFGTIPQVSIGPTSLMALMTLQYCYEKPVQFVVVLALIAGIVEFLMGIFDLGFIVNFIPLPVTKAFTTGTALIVAFVQLKNLLGIKVKGLLTPRAYWQHINMPDAILGFTCLIILLALKQLSNIKLKRASSISRGYDCWQKFLWYLSISRNALVVFSCALYVYTRIEGSPSKELVPFNLTTKVESAWPTFKLPPITFTYNTTTYSFLYIGQELGSGMFVVPIVAVLANVAIAKAFAKHKILDASQEMLSLGLCNIAGSFFSAMPTCGAFTRSAVSEASGVKTPMAGIYTGIIVLLAITYLTPYFQYIPKSTLSAVLIGAVIFMVDFKPLFQLWRINKKDFFSWIGCLTACLIFGVEIGLLYGIILNVTFVLLRLGKPCIQVSEKKGPNATPFIYIVPLTDIYYSGMELLRIKITAACYHYNDRSNLTILLDCSRFQLFDTTFIDIIKSLAKELSDNNIVLILQTLKSKQQKLLQINHLDNYVHFENNNYENKKDLINCDSRVI